MTSSEELRLISQLKIDEDTLVNIPESIKIKMLDRLLKDTDTNVCLQFLTAEFIGKTLLSVYNKKSAFCVFNRILKSSLEDIPSDDCRDIASKRVHNMIEKIGAEKCPYSGVCPKVCHHRFKLDEDFLKKITSGMKISLYNKLVKNFIDENNPCFLSYIMLNLLEYLNDHVLLNKAKQLQQNMEKIIPYMPYPKCRADVRRRINKINNR
jgi:hypothetical protein